MFIVTYQGAPVKSLNYMDSNARIGRMLEDLMWFYICPNWFDNGFTYYQRIGWGDF